MAKRECGEELVTGAKLGALMVVLGGSLGRVGTAEIEVVRPVYRQFAWSACAFDYAAKRSPLNFTPVSAKISSVMPSVQYHFVNCAR